jgi:hypothetical protein
MMPVKIAQWEFTSVYSLEEANSLGRQGWELVSVTETPFRVGYHLKRVLTLFNSALDKK